MLKNTGTPGPGSTGSKASPTGRGQLVGGQLAEAKVESGSTSPRRGSTGRERKDDLVTSAKTPDSLATTKTQKGQLVEPRR